jgi:meso-butanediol dehydrogenase / (S,S)-butanediol dehydrogenase / diacetyl reductase
MRLEGKKALVTGSTRGVGEEIAYSFAREGAAVAVTGRNPERGERVADRIRSLGGEAVYIQADLSKDADAERLVSQAADALGGLSILVNNAAATDLMATSTKPIADNTNEEFDAIVKVALYGTFWCIKFAIPHLVASGSSSIINVSSMASIQGFPGVPAYTAAKGGVNALTRQVAFDYGKAGVRVNTIIIGVVVNELTQGVVSTPEMAAAMEAIHFTPRLGECADVAHLAVYLGSDESSFMTAVEMAMDGGSTMKGPLPAQLVDAGISAER